MAQTYEIGYKFRKEFDGDDYEGEIVSFESTAGYYHVIYEDGDEEDLERHELDELKPAEEEESNQKKAAQKAKAASASSSSSNKSKEKEALFSKKKAAHLPDADDSSEVSSDSSWDGDKKPKAKKKELAAKKKRKRKVKFEEFTMQVLHNRRLKSLLNKIHKGVFNGTKRLTISFPRYCPCLPVSDDVDKLLRACGTLPNLEEICFENLTAREGCVESECVTALFERCPDKFQKISFVGAKFPSSDRGEVEGAFQNQTKLKKLEMTNCYYVMMGFDEETIQDEYVGALRTKAQRDEHRLYLQTNQAYMMKHPIDYKYLLPGLKLLQNLESLIVSHEGLEKVSTKDFVEFVQSKPLLSELKLRNTNLPDNPMVQLVPILRKHENLCFLSLGRIGMDTAGRSAFVEMLRENASLEEVYLRNANQNGNNLIPLIAEALRENRCLRKFQLVCSNFVIDDTSAHAMAQLAEENSRIQEFALNNMPGFAAFPDLRSKFNFFLSLNSYGRDNFFHGAHSKAAKVEILCSCKEHLSCLFYFLRMDPSLCESGL